MGSALPPRPNRGPQPKLLPPMPGGNRRGARPLAPSPAPPHPPTRESSSQILTYRKKVRGLTRRRISGVSSRARARARAWARAQGPGLGPEPGALSIPRGLGAQGPGPRCSGSRPRAPGLGPAARSAGPSPGPWAQGPGPPAPRPWARQDPPPPIGVTIMGSAQAQSAGPGPDPGPWASGPGARIPPLWPPLLSLAHWI